MHSVCSRCSCSVIHRERVERPWVKIAIDGFSAWLVARDVDPQNMQRRFHANLPLFERFDFLFSERCLLICCVGAAD